MVEAALAIGVVALGLSVILMFGCFKIMDTMVELQANQEIENERLEKRIIEIEKKISYLRLYKR